MKNYSSIIAFLGIFTLIIFPLYEANTMDQDYLDIVSKSFHATEGEFYELYIEAWAQIKQEGISEEELLNLFKDISKTLGLDLTNFIIDRSEDFIKIYCLEVREEKAFFHLSLESLQSEDLESGTFLGIQVRLVDLKDSQKYYDLVKQVFVKNNINSDIGVTIVGKLSGQLKEQECKKQIASAFSSVNAQVQEGIANEGLLSFSAYSPFCKKYLDVNGKKINLNIALRYHSIDENTYIHIGAPLIFQEY